MTRIGQTEDGTIVEIDLQKQIGSHTAIIGNTGAGKSITIRQIVEKTNGTFLQIILDVEDEFHTFREIGEYVIIGGPYADVSLSNPAILCDRIVRGSDNVIVQLNTLSLEQRQIWIGTFIDALMMMPRETWKPILVVLDEADRYAPQSGGAKSLQPIVNLLSMGRKRGFTAVVATQRLSKISKNVTGEITNWYVGRTAQMLDRRHASDMLGFGAKSDNGIGLRDLKPGQFWCFGVAIATKPQLIMVDIPSSTHLKLGATAYVPPKMPANVAERLDIGNKNRISLGFAGYMAAAGGSVATILYVLNMLVS
jgi:hypothetical protein